MKREDYHKLLAEIGGGGDTIGKEAEVARRHAEEEVLVSLNEHYGGCLLLGDALHQFYVDTIREVAARLATATSTQLLQMFVHWHLLSISRYFAAFDLFRRGYYFESATLARTLWETALTLAALRRGIVTIDEVFGGGGETGAGYSPREIIDRIRRVDSRIQRTLIWKNPDLNQTAKDAIQIFLNLVNSATHKSSLGLAMNLGLVARGQPVPIFPRFDAKQVEVSWNILFLAMWSLMVTLSYLDHLLPDSNEPLGIRYRKLLASFEELLKTPPNSVVQGFGEVISKVFVISAS